MRKTRFVDVGVWTTLERLWGRTGLAVFVGPARAEIKVRYGNGPGLGTDRQRQTLDGLHPRELRVGVWSLVYARMQILVSRSREVTYDFYPTSRSRDPHAGDDASIAYASCRQAGPRERLMPHPPRPRRVAPIGARVHLANTVTDVVDVSRAGALVVNMVRACRRFPFSDRKRGPKSLGPLKVPISCALPTLLDIF
jgi:hypothetical protein